MPIQNAGLPASARLGKAKARAAAAAKAVAKAVGVVMVATRMGAPHAVSEAARTRMRRSELRSVGAIVTARMRLLSPCQLLSAEVRSLQRKAESYGILLDNPFSFGPLRGPCDSAVSHQVTREDERNVIYLTIPPISGTL